MHRTKCADEIRSVLSPPPQTEHIPFPSENTRKVVRLLTYLLSVTQFPRPRCLPCSPAHGPEPGPGPVTVYHQFLLPVLTGGHGCSPAGVTGNYVCARRKQRVHRLQRNRLLSRCCRLAIPSSLTLLPRLLPAVADSLFSCGMNIYDDGGGGGCCCCGCVCFFPFVKLFVSVWRLVLARGNSR
jgi:hypothetical protein